MTKKGIAACGLFVILLIVIAIWARTFAKDPLIYALGGYIILALLSVGAILFKPFRNRFEEFVNENVFIPSKKLRILIVGLGRSGKTSIIRHVIADDCPKREKSTNHFTIYDELYRLGLNDPVRCPFMIADYKGQKLSQITNDKNLHPEFFGKTGQKLINVIIFVVDLFPEIRNNKGDLLSDERIVKRYKSNAGGLIEERFKEHEEYNIKYIVQQVIELASPQSLFSVRLLINKIDLLREVVKHGYLPQVTEKNLEKYTKKLFSKISDTIRTACEENEIESFSDHFVSAKRGDNIKIIFGNIFETFHKGRQK
jgi:GTPase SAR1 family protein